MDEGGRGKRTGRDEKGNKRRDKEEERVDRGRNCGRNRNEGRLYTLRSCISARGREEKGTREMRKEIREGKKRKKGRIEGGSE